MKRAATRVCKLHVYQSSSSPYEPEPDWRWRLKSPNGRIIADSGEGYSSKGNAMKAAQRLVDATIVIVQDDES